jgi:hypothetical protein
MKAYLPLAIVWAIATVAMFTLLWRESRRR